jgi:hypothetical protein
MAFVASTLANGFGQRDGVEGNSEIGVALCIRQRDVNGVFAIER